MEESAWRRNAGQCGWSRTGWIQVCCGWEVLSWTIDMEDSVDGEGGWLGTTVEAACVSDRDLQGSG